jgi:lactose/L-arabinose transport system ATP-binding protein
MTGIELRGIGKRYGAAEVIDKIDLTLEEGSLTVFVGPSGCGKSTLLRMIAGLEPISSGELVIGGHRANDATPTQRGVAMVFQNYALYPHLSVRDNIGFPLRMAGVPRKDIATRVDQAAERLQIGPLLARKPAALSGGQRQRVAIGRAIVRDPDIFLFDEPLSNLDAELRVQMRLEIAKLHEALDATMVYVTHDQVEAMTLADRIVVLRAGKVEQTGAPMEIYDDPVNIFVAGFIGSPRMNLLAGHVTAHQPDGLAVAFEQLDAPALTVRVADRVPVGTKVLVGLRPEAFAPDGDVPLTVTADLIENLGGTSYLYANLRPGETLVIDAGDDRSVRAGVSHRTAFHSARALLFDPQSGMRIR